LDDTTDEKARVAEFTSESLQELDASAGFQFPPGSPSPGDWADGAVGVPSLERVLSEFPGCTFIIEVKDPTAVPGVVLAVRRRPPGAVTYLTSFQQSTCRELQAYSTAESPLLLAPGWSALLSLVVRAKLGRRPKVPYAAVHLPPRIDLLMATPRFARRFLSAPQGAAAVVGKLLSRVGVNLVTPRVVRWFHEADIRVDVWTIDDPEFAARLALPPTEAKVDGVMTDRPRAIARFLRQQGG
jgi:glycerophosphoryl diester phosphodiesterase